MNAKRPKLPRALLIGEFASIILASLLAIPTPNAVPPLLIAGDGELRFEVVDDGIGFDPRATRAGTGLQGMTDRIDAIGGSLEIRSTPGGGTVVNGRVPVVERD
jgi:hypothetical protein